MVHTKNENKTGFVFVRVKIVMQHGLTVTQEFCKLSNVRICSFVCLTLVDASMESLMMNFHKTLDASHVLLLSSVSFQASAPLPCDFVDWTLPWLVPTSSALRIVNTVRVHRAQLKNSVNIISAIEGTRSSVFSAIFVGITKLYFTNVEDMVMCTWPTKMTISVL